MKIISCDICKKSIQSAPHQLKDEFKQKNVDDVCVECVNYLDKRIEIYNKQYKKGLKELVDESVKYLKR